MFRHHNPLINIEHYNYYVKCVNRFKDLLQKQEHKLFIMIFLKFDNYNDNIKINNIKNKIIDFNIKFSKYTSNYTLLIIIQIPNKQENHHKFTYNDNIHFLELHTLGLSNGVEFTNKNDNIYLDNIIKSKYNFNVNI